jgi:hypothetical protein
MLTLLSTLKTRLAIVPEDTTNDALLTNAIAAISARFDKETHRTLARTLDFAQEFDGATTEVVASCYPIESVSNFETKTSESTGWQELTPAPEFLIRSSCIFSLPSSFSLYTLAFSLCRVTYTGGYLLPGSPPPDPPVAGCQALPADLETAAVEQIAAWFLNRDKLGLKTIWPHYGTYQQFFPWDLLPGVAAVLKKYTRWTL